MPSHSLPTGAGAAACLALPKQTKMLSPGMEKLKLKYSKNPIRGDIYNLSQLKILLDDLVKEYLTSVKSCEQSMLLTDARIAVGLISTGIAAAIVYLSLKTEFEQHKNALILLISIYFVLNFFIEVYTRYIGSSFVFTDRTVVTSATPPEAVYTVLVYNKDRLIPEKYNKSVFDLFDESGRLIHEEFLSDLEELFDKNKNC
jgi:hypothetical protein